MALEGPRRESPQVIPLARRVPNPGVTRSGLFWSVLTAYGAGFFVTAALTIIFALLFRLIGATPTPGYQLASAAATGTALAVAYRSGGRDAVILYTVILVVEQVIAFPALMRFCLMTVSSPVCSPFSYVLSFWPQILGVGIAYGLVRWLRTVDGDRNQTLEPAGALALTQSLLGRVLAVLFLSASAFEAALGVIVAALVSGLACGLVLLRRVAPQRQWRTLGVVAFAVIGQWAFVAVPQFMEFVGIGGGVAMGGLNFVGFLSPIMQIGVAVLVLYMAAARKVAAAP